MAFILFDPPFFTFFVLWGRQKRGFCSYVSSIAKRNSDLHISPTFERSILIDKSKEDRLRRWTLKRFQMTFLRTRLGLWVDFSLNSTWLFINSVKRTFKVKCSIGAYLPLFFINRGYSVNNWLNFILTVIKRDYNTNDQLKFILLFIRRDNDLNDRLKLVKNGRKGYRK